MSNNKTRVHKKFTYNPAHKAKGLTNVRVKSRAPRSKDDKGNWEFSFFQRGKNQANEQKIKADCPTGSFDHSKIPELMNPQLSLIDILKGKLERKEHLSKADIIRIENHLSKEKHSIKRDIEKIKKNGLNADVETSEGRIRKLFLALDHYIKINDNYMIYYVSQKLSEFDIPEHLMRMNKSKYDKMTSVISKLDTIKIQFTKFHSNMPPLNVRGFKDLDPWQKDVIRNIDAKKSTILQAPTSAGKSILTGYIYLEDGIKAIVVVPTDILAWQSASLIGKITGKDIPILTKTFKSIPRRDEMIEKIKHMGIVVGTPTEIVDYMPFISDIKFDWLVIDEIHMMGKENCCEMETIAQYYCDIPTLALSATIGNAEELRSWFHKTGNTNMEIIKCNKRFFNLERFYYNDEKTSLERIHPLSMVTIDDFKDRSILKKSLNPTPPDVWDLAEKISSVFDLGVISPYNFFSKEERIHLDKTYIYIQKLLEFMIEKLETDEDKIQSILDMYCHDELEEHEINYVNMALHLKQENKIPALIFITNSHECLTVVRDFSDKVKEMETEKYPKLYKSRMKDAKRSTATDKKLEKMTIGGKKVSGMGEKRLHKEMMKGTFEQMESEQSEISILEPHKDFNFNKNQYFSQHVIEEWANQLKKYFPQCGSDYHYLIDLLWRGVGVYVKGLPDPYLRIVQNLACGGKLGIVFSDDSLVFGVSMPFRTAVITNDLAIDSMLYHQMAGRAGRRGLDDRGNVIFIGSSGKRIKELSVSVIPDVIGHDTMWYGSPIAEKLSESTKWSRIMTNYLSKDNTEEDITDFYEGIIENISEGGGWDYTNTDNKNMLHLMWQFRETEDCYRIPFIINFIRKIFHSCNPSNEATQIEFAKFISQYICYEEVSEDSPYILSTVECSKKYNIHEHLETIALEVPTLVDSKVYECIRMNSIMKLDSKQVHMLRERLLEFGNQVRIIQHYFYHSNEVNITRMVGKLLTRIWWIYHMSSPIMY
jgi:replicative superfamily II helicase